MGVAIYTSSLVLWLEAQPVTSSGQMLTSITSQQGTLIFAKREMLLNL